MSFVSIAFVAFVVTVFVLYWFVFKSARWQNVLLVVASLVFYGWADWQCVALLMLTAVVTYASARGMTAASSRPVRRALATGNTLINLGILGLFKYFNFFADNFTSLFHLLGMRADVVTLHLLLPVGISFYTFQAIGYTIDVYRRQTDCEHNPVTFMAFLSFFPQLVAGPIERASHLLPQMQRPRTFDYGQAADGMRQMLWGYAKKVIVADSCGQIVDQVWGDVSHTGSVQLLVTGVLFAIQIYGDFSGYSDIAIGCAKLFGIKLSHNFAYPFFACDMRQVWRRWHISLMSWFKDYVYIPLGGSRCQSAWRNHLNLLVVFLLSGLWHGANWTFVLWGGYNALLVMLSPRRPLFSGSAGRLVATVVTFLLFALGFVIFRAPDVHQLGDYMIQMCSGTSGIVYGWHAMAYSALMLLVEWFNRHQQHGLQMAGRGIMRYRACRWLLYYALAMIVIAFYLTANHQTAFIYFRF